MSSFVQCECGRRFGMPEEGNGLTARCPSCSRELSMLDPEPPGGTFSPSQASAGCGRSIVRVIVRVGVVFACICSFGLLAVSIPSVFSPGRSVKFLKCRNNLRLIGHGMYGYHEANGRLPAAAITDKDGRPLLSWRVAILPYLADTEFQSLYARFHLDEPWDSPHNFALLDSMPRVYTCPSDQELKPGMTGYEAVVGADTAFTLDFRPLRLRDFTDGSGNTILVVESRRAVPWTKPEDLAFGSTLPLNGLGSYHVEGLNALFADGGVRFLWDSMPPDLLGALLSRNGNETDTLKRFVEGPPQRRGP